MVSILLSPTFPSSHAHIQSKATLTGCTRGKGVTVTHLLVATLQG